MSTLNTKQINREEVMQYAREHDLFKDVTETTMNSNQINKLKVESVITNS